MPNTLFSPRLGKNKSSQINHEETCFEIGGKEGFVIFCILKNILQRSG
jgi:hypothetical protein